MGAPIHLKIDDIDGEENGGSFASQEIEVIFTNDDLTGKPKRNNDNKKYVKRQNIELTEGGFIPMYGTIPAPFKP